MKRLLPFVCVFCLIFTTGCDVPWKTVGAAVGYLNVGGSVEGLTSIIGDHGGGNDESWWDNNDEHFDWLWWPFN